jgi:hypothetical protein
LASGELFLQFMQSRKSLAIIFASLAILCAAIFAYRHWRAKDALSVRLEMLGQLPADTDAIFFLDFDTLRSSPFLAQILAWAPQSSQDPDYAQFVKETGFDYERDLDRIAIAISPAGAGSNYFLEAEGRFDRKKIEAYVGKYGKLQNVSGRMFFGVPLGSATSSNSTAGNSTAGNSKPGNSGKTVYLTFLREDRVALSSTPLALTVSAPQKISSEEWREHFRRLAGAPIFGIFFQESSLLNYAQQTTGGYRSPQLAALLAQLEWLTIAAKPEGDVMRVVADGESSSETVVRQLQEMLGGIALLARAGLNEPRTRKDVDPQVREAMVGLLDSADIQKMDRGTSKSVRVSFIVTPKLLEAGHMAATAPGQSSGH